VKYNKKNNKKEFQSSILLYVLSYTLYPTLLAQD